MQNINLFYKIFTSLNCNKILKFHKWYPHLKMYSDVDLIKIYDDAAKLQPI